TEDMRADYEVRAIQMMRQRYPWMGVTFLWNLNWSVLDPWYTGPAHYSIINADYSPRPVYNALKALPK
ncbi:MAG: cellulase family glycosylhydrolase, partial [Thermomicrobiales bacterium]